MGGVGNILSGAVNLADLDVDSNDVVRRSSRFEGFEDDSEDEDVIRDDDDSDRSGDAFGGSGSDFSFRGGVRGGGNPRDGGEPRGVGVSARFRAGDLVSVPVARAVSAAPTDHRAFDDDEENASPRSGRLGVGSASMKSRSPPRRGATFTSRDVHDDDASVDRTCRANRWDRCSGTSVAVAGRRKIRENSAAALLADLERARRRVGRGFGVGGWDGPGLDLGAGGSRPGTAPARRRATPAEEEEEEEDEWMRKMRLRVEQRRREMFDPTWRREGSDKTKHAIEVETRGAEVGCVIVRSYRRAPADSTSSSPATTVQEYVESRRRL